MKRVCNRPIQLDAVTLCYEVVHPYFYEQLSTLDYGECLDLDEFRVYRTEGRYYENVYTIKLDNGTQPGKTLRLRGKGLPAVQGYGNGKGDLVVNISVYVPKTLSREEKQAIDQFRQSDNFKGDKQTKDSIFQRFKNYFN